MIAAEQTFRLFVAVHAPATVKEALGHAQERWRARLPRECVRWTNPEQIHLTLRFLGDVPAGKVEALTEAVRRACGGISPILMQAEGLGFFPPKRLPRVIWVGLGGEVERISALVEAVQKATMPFSSEPVAEKFTGHLTIGRCKGMTHQHARILAQIAKENASLEFGSWTADAVAIVRSEPSSAGHHHTELAKIPLCGKSL